MGSPKFSTFIVGMIIVSMVAGVMALSMAEFSTNYGIEYADNESLVVMNKLTNLTKNVERYERDILQQNKSTSKLQDILGGLFDTGYTAAKTAADSFDIMNSMIDAGFNRLNLGEAGAIIKGAIITALLVMIVIGIVISVVVRKDV